MPDLNRDALCFYFLQHGCEFSATDYINQNGADDTRVNLRWNLEIKASN